LRLNHPGRNNTLRLTMNVEPAFTSARTVVNYPKSGMTSLLLSSGDSSSAITGMLVRVLNFGLAGADGKEKVEVGAKANATSSNLIFAVGHFTDDLAYDPGILPDHRPPETVLHLIRTCGCMEQICRCWWGDQERMVVAGPTWR
jgi:hypothetical protein